MEIQERAAALNSNAGNLSVGPFILRWMYTPNGQALSLRVENKNLQHGPLTLHPDHLKNTLQVPLPPSPMPASCVVMITLTPAAPSFDYRVHVFVPRSHAATIFDKSGTVGL